ncbi:MAG: homoserine dehydrogenase [Spirochaetes bacterium]|nr:MAG: homoserine dehydrogenase [Spirochaetota bacterium]
MKKVGIAIIGLGTIGTGLYKLIMQNGDLIRNKSGINITINKAVDINKAKKDELNIPNSVFTTSVDEALNSKEVDIVVELIGGTTTAKNVILKAIGKGKHIVTANKALLAQYKSEIVPLLVSKKLELGCEASVGGGIPIIKTLKEALVGNKIHKIIGILNGTSNFILTKMIKEGVSFKEALKTAQKLGFAETDPTLDISGGDAKHKITILSSLAFSTEVDINKVFVEGIEKIDKLDVSYAMELGFVLKLLAIAERVDDGIIVGVHPALVSEKNPLAAVNWEDNAIMVYSDFLGKSMYYGKGAGANPTSSAVVADIVDIALKIKSNYEYNPKVYSFFNNLKQLNFEESNYRYYFKFNVLDRPGILSKISGILGNHNISIASVIQKEVEEKNEYVPLIMLTHRALEENVRKAFREIVDLREVKGKNTILRVIDD